MSDALSSKPILESFAYALDLEIQIRLYGADFEIRAVCAIASAVEQIVQAFAADLDPQLGAIKLGVTAESGASTIRLHPLLDGDELSQARTTALIVTALWSSVIGLKAGVESDARALAAYPAVLAGILKREFIEIEQHLQKGQAVEAACLVKESWEYTQRGRRRMRSEEWQVASGQIRRPGDTETIQAKTKPLAAAAQIPLRWPFRPLSFFGPGDPFAPWWERRKE
jgi:hypothetical protein